MAPVVAPLLALLLGSAGSVSVADAKPLMPGRHAPPGVANMLAASRRTLHKALAKYYGVERGLTRPVILSEKRATTLPSGWTYDGCVDESWDERLLEGASFSSQSMTTLLCLTQCQKLGFTLGGTEYGDECYCGSSKVGSGGTVASDSTCATPCAGDSSSSCGGLWYLSLYSYTANTTTTTACVTGSATASVDLAQTILATTATTTTATAATTATATHTDVTDQSEWYSLGCAVDTTSRILSSFSDQYWTGMTTDACLTMCEDKGYSFAGTEYGQECWCGSTMPSTITYSSTACDMPCDGDKSDTCGGDWAIELYELVKAGNSTACSTTASATATTTIANVNLAITTTTAATAAGTTATGTTATGTTATAAATTVPSSSSTHNVWAHHMVGNTYPYTESSWLSDITAATSYGIDGFALNMGSDSWQPDRINDAYTAAASSSTGFKLFLSLDMTALSCSSSSDASTLVNLVSRWASHSNQAWHNGKVLVSTFAGSDCTFGTGSSDGWQTLFVDALTANGISIFFVPSLFSDVSTFSSDSWMDGELNWNSGWPSGSSDIGASTDAAYVAALGSKEYMPAISPFFFTHFGADSWNKNWLYRGDDWLYCTRWEEVIAMRSSVNMTEILTWNDYGESSYIGPIGGALPTGSDAWVDGFEHHSINALTLYYATAFKTGSYPAITQDNLIMWTRPHPYDATASDDSVGRPTGWNWTDDYLYAVVLAQSAATVTLTSGSNSQTFSVSAGLTKLKISSSAGGISGSIVRSGSTVASYASSSFSYTTTPSTYNYNYFVGSSS